MKRNTTPAYQSNLTLLKPASFFKKLMMADYEFENNAPVVQNTALLIMDPYHNKSLSPNTSAQSSLPTHIVPTGMFEPTV